MDEIKNNIENEEVVESEEVMEVALADDVSDAEEANDVAVSNKDENQFEYTDGEMSGLTEAQRRRKEIFDKITTGILIALMASPLAIVLYIFLWFILR